MSASETYFVAATTVTPGPAAARIASHAARTDVGRHGSSARARSSSASRSFRVGSSTTSASSSPSTRPSSGPSRKPRAIRSEPSTASSVQRGRASPLCLHEAPEAGERLVFFGGKLFRPEVGVLVHQELGGELVAMRCQETAGGPGVELAVQLERVLANDGDHLVLEPDRIPQPAQNPPCQLRARLGVVVRATEAVCLRFAKVVQQGRQAYGERSARSLLLPGRPRRDARREEMAGAVCRACSRSPRGTRAAPPRAHPCRAPTSTHAAAPGRAVGERARRGRPLSHHRPHAPARRSEGRRTPAASAPASPRRAGSRAER